MYLLPKLYRKSKIVQKHGALFVVTFIKVRKQTVLSVGPYPPLLNSLHIPHDRLMSAHEMRLVEDQLRHPFPVVVGPYEAQTIE